MICPKCGELYENHTCYWSPCADCKEGYSSFHKTIIESPEWDMWCKEQDKRMREGKIVKGKFNKDIFNVCECEECGQISPDHWRAFIGFIRPAISK